MPSEAPQARPAAAPPGRRPGWAILTAVAAAAGLLALARPLMAEALPLDFALTLSATDLSHREMTESGGLESQSMYKHYRMSGSRFLVSPQVTLGGRWSLRAVLGAVDLRAHASEGETTQWDHAPAYGAGFDAVLAEFLEKRLGLVLSADYLTVRLDDGRTVRVRHNSSGSGGTVDLDWSEWSVSLRAVGDYRKCRLWAGLRYSDVSAEQDRRFENGTDFHSTFEPDHRLGVVAGAAYMISPHLSAVFDLDFVDQTSFSLSLRYGF